MSVTIRIKRGTASQWASSTNKLSTGELGLDSTNNILKVGNGSSFWVDLPAINVVKAEIDELSQDAINDAINNYIGVGTNVTFTYDDVNNQMVFDTGPNVVLQSDLTTAITGANEYADDAVAGLGNSLSGTYVLVSDVANPDGVAPLDSNSLIPDQYIPSTIARDSEIPSLAGYATETYVNNAVSNLVDSAPTTLNTLNELAAAINDDASYAATITTALGTKAPLDSPSFTGSIYATNSTITAAQFVKPYGTSSQFLKADGSSDSTSYATQASLDLKTDQLITINAQSSGYTVATSDLGKLIEMSGGGTLTIVDSLSFPIGFTCDVLQTGSSQVTIAGSGFTPNATPGLKLRAQWSSATLIKRAIGTWVIIGDLSA